jgi:hypothetical protein
MNFSIETLVYITIGLQVVILLFVLFISIRYIRVKRIRESEYWTDYEHNDIVFRVYKWEFESQAFNGINRGQVLDRGDLNQFYRWLMFKKKQNEKS